MNILIVNSSAHGDASLSGRLTAAFAEILRRRRSDVRIVVRDIGSNPIPHLVSGTIAGIRGVAQSEAEKEALSLSDSLVDELRAADLILIGAPMYNFGMPSTLKSWFDHVLRARVTFRYTENGPEGLLQGKKAVIIETRGGVYSEGPGAAMDAQEPHLRTLLGFIGITDVRFVRAEGTAVSADAAAGAFGKAIAELEGLVAEECALAA